LAYAAARLHACRVSGVFLDLYRGRGRIPGCKPLVPRIRRSARAATGSQLVQVQGLRPEDESEATLNQLTVALARLAAMTPMATRKVMIGPPTAQPAALEGHCWPPGNAKMP
jgi:hypothetical protein